MSILVIDQSPVQRRLIVNTLKEGGYDGVEEYPSLEPAYTSLVSRSGKEQRAVELVVLDWKLPRDARVEFMNQIRTSGYRHISVIAASYQVFAADVMQGAAMGVDDFVLLPLDGQKLLSKVKSVLAARRDQQSTTPQKE